MIMSRLTEWFVCCLVWAVPLCCAAFVIFLVRGLGELRQDKPAQANTTVTVTEYLRTVQHDGHRFVSSRSTGGLLHHPDCPCGKAEEAK
jgi:hypothetical protein